MPIPEALCVVLGITALIGVMIAIGTGVVFATMFVGVVTVVSMIIRGGRLALRGSSRRSRLGPSHSPVSPSSPLPPHAPRPPLETWHHIHQN
jgi:hypothetical protein